MRVSEGVGAEKRDIMGGSVYPLLAPPPGVFICRGKEDALVTRNLVPGESVYGEKRVSIAVRVPFFASGAR